MRKEYIRPEIVYEDIEDCDDIILASSQGRGWAIDGNPPVEVEKEGDSWKNNEGNDEDGWGDFIDID